MQIAIYTQKRNGLHSSVKVYTPVVQGEILRTVCRKSRVRVLLTFFLNGYMTDSVGLYQYIPVVIMSYIRLCKYIPACTGLYRSVKGTKLHFKSPTAERRHASCVGGWRGLNPRQPAPIQQGMPALTFRLLRAWSVPVQTSS